MFLKNANRVNIYVCSPSSPRFSKSGAQTLDLFFFLSKLTTLVSSCSLVVLIFNIGWWQRNCYLSNFRREYPLAYYISLLRNVIKISKSVSSLNFCNSFISTASFYLLVDGNFTDLVTQSKNSEVIFDSLSLVGHIDNILGNSGASIFKIHTLFIERN